MSCCTWVRKFVSQSRWACKRSTQHTSFKLFDLQKSQPSKHGDVPHRSSVGQPIYIWRAGDILGMFSWSCKIKQSVCPQCYAVDTYVRWIMNFHLRSSLLINMCFWWIKVISLSHYLSQKLQHGVIMFDLMHHKHSVSTHVKVTVCISRLQLTEIC